MFRVGLGEDIHRIDDSRPLVLGGLLIEEGPGLAGHSDADVLLHAVTDAVLGAAALGDIGQHFPPSEERYRDADSADLLRRALALAAGAGWQVVNVDCTVWTEVPLLRPYIPDLRARLAAILGLDVPRVSVKAKTAEGLGPVGRREAMEARAVVLMESVEGGGTGRPAGRRRR